MRLLVPALAIVLAVGFLAAPPAVPPAAHAADDYTPEQWEKSWNSKVKSNLKRVDKMAKWCDKNDLEWTANWVRRHGFVIAPDGAELREELGYERGPEGNWVQNDLKRDQLRDLIDLEDPNSGKFPTNMAKLRKAIAKDFASLARKAAKEAEASGNSTFLGQSKRAWEMVINITLSGTKEADAAHKALGHPKFDGRYVWPEMVGYLEARKRRKDAGAAIAATSPPIEKVAPKGFIAEAGFTATAVQAGPFLIQSVYKQESTDRIGAWAFKAMSDLVERYGFPETIVERIRKTHFDYVEKKDDNEPLKQYLMKGAKWDKERVERLVKHFGATSLDDGGNVFGRADGPGADDSSAHNAAHTVVEAAHAMAVADLGLRLGHIRRAGAEAWMREAISYDCTRRLMGTSTSLCGTFGRYGTNFTPRPGEDVWLQLAKRQVELDDDVPIRELYGKGINDLQGPETVKAYALLQYLFEHDEAAAQKFIWHAIAHGTPAAIVDVYGAWLGTPEATKPDGKTDLGSLFQRPEYRKAMSELDKRYRVWIVRTQ